MHFGRPLATPSLMAHVFSDTAGVLWPLCPRGGASSARSLPFRRQEC